MKVMNLVKNCLAVYGGVMLIVTYYYYKQDNEPTISFKKNAARKGLDILMPDDGGKESWTFEFWSEKSAEEFLQFVYDKLDEEGAVTVADIYDRIGKKVELKDQERGWTYFNVDGIRRSRRKLLDKWYVCFEKPKKLF